MHLHTPPTPSAADVCFTSKQAGYTGSIRRTLGTPLAPRGSGTRGADEPGKLQAGGKVYKVTAPAFPPNNKWQLVVVSESVSIMLARRNQKQSFPATLGRLFEAILGATVMTGKERTRFTAFARREYGYDGAVRMADREFEIHERKMCGTVGTVIVVGSSFFFLIKSSYRRSGSLNRINWSDVGASPCLALPCLPACLPDCLSGHCHHPSR